MTLDSLSESERSVKVTITIQIFIPVLFFYRLSSITSHSFIKEGIATASDRGENRVSYDTSCACWCWCARGSLVILRELFDAGLKHPFPVVSAVSQQLRPGAFDVFLQTESEQFLSRVSILLLTRDIDIVILSVRLSVCLSVRLSVTRWYCMKTA